MRSTSLDDAVLALALDDADAVLTLALDDAVLALAWEGAASNALSLIPATVSEGPLANAYLSATRLLAWVPWGRRLFTSMSIPVH